MSSLGSLHEVDYKFQGLERVDNGFCALGALFRNLASSALSNSLDVTDDSMQVDENLTILHDVKTVVHCFPFCCID